MDHLKIWTEDAPDGYTNVVIEGDVAAFMWLIAAAGNARDGFNRNQADVTTGEPIRLILQPLNPNQPRDQAPRSRTAHLTVDHRAAREAAKIIVEQSDYSQIPQKVLAELAHRGVQFAVIADPAPPEPELAPAPAGQEAADMMASAGKPTAPVTALSRAHPADPAASEQEPATETVRDAGEAPQPEPPSPPAHHPV